VYRVEISVAMKPGRLEDAIADIHAANEATQRLAGITGQMFVVYYGAQAYGGTRLTYDFDSAEALGRFDTISISDPAMLALGAKITAENSAWIMPAAREALLQIV
jgi:hypothetical protein